MRLRHGVSLQRVRYEPAAGGPPRSSIAVLTKMVAFNGIPCTKSYVRLDKNAVPKKKERGKSVRAPQESDPQERKALLQGR